MQHYTDKSMPIDSVCAKEIKHLRFLSTFISDDQQNAVANRIKSLFAQ